MWLEVLGKRVFAATSGGEPPDVVLIHGAGGDHSVWDGLLGGVGAALAFDLPGHGRSEGPALDSIAVLADWTAAALDAAGVAGAAVAGHSMGALVALELAARHPPRLRALALLGVATAMPVHGELLRAARDDLPAAAAMIAAWGFARDGADPVAVERTRHMLEASGAGVLRADLAACDAYADGPAAAARVQCPTLVVIGSQDRMSPPAAGMALAGSIAGAATVMLVGAGHMMMAEQPEAVLEALRGPGLFAR